MTMAFKPRRILRGSSPSSWEWDTLHIHEGWSHQYTHAERLLGLEGGGVRTNGADGLVKDIFEAFLRQRGALEELDGAYMLLNRDALLVCEWLHATA